MATGKMAVIGDKDSVLAFKAAGVDVFSQTNPFEIRDTLKKLARSGYSIIFITEKQAAEVQEAIQRFKEQAYPIIIPIPDSSGTNGFGMKGIKADVEKAIGTDIIFNKDGR